MRARPADGARLLRAAVYAVPDGSRPLTVDLRLPENAPGPVPLVVIVHGGGWRTGPRDDLGPRLRHWQPGPFARLAQAGFAVACPEYRLSGEASHPAQADDLATALGWLTTRADDLGVDTGRTVLWGESAGGHLSAGSEPPSAVREARGGVPPGIRAPAPTPSGTAVAEPALPSVLDISLPAAGTLGRTGEITSTLRPCRFPGHGPGVVHCGRPTGAVHGRLHRFRGSPARRPHLRSLHLGGAEKCESLLPGPPGS
ncbi:alpha/beta hydrolase fold domain-containing protein [Streptomyces sp. NPDC005791]|uniref:alpha/beta hydrolase n=1 Tax=unclassified Streptomyces TaxID=2593676 RepID=UPI0033EFB994